MERLKPSTQFPTVKSGYTDKIKAALLKDSVSVMLQKGAIRVVKEISPGYYSRLFLVPKPRIIDLSHLNRYISIPHFQMEISSFIRDSLRQGEWVTSLDLQDSYFHLLIKKKYRK